MNKLITASLQSGNIGRLINFPRRLIEPFELDYISWIAEFNTKYGKIPSLARFEEEFGDFIPIELLDDFDVDDIADKTLERKKLSYFISSMSEVVEKARLEGTVSKDNVYGVMRTITEAEDDNFAYTTFDRSKYRSRTHTKSIPFFAGVLNKAMGELHAGDYCLLVARLGVGKSLTTQWQATQWMLEGMKVLFVSQEMLATEIFSRIDGMVASFNPLELRKEDGMDLSALLNVAQITSKASGGEIFAPRGLKSPEQIAMAARFLGADIIIVDGVYQLAPDMMHLPPARWERITEVSGQLKQMAQSLERPLLATTQLKRTGKTEAFTPEDIAFADALGQDADQVITIVKDTINPNRLEAALIKNRYGPEMTTLLEIDFETMKIKEVR